MMTLTVRYWASLSDRIGRKSSLLIWSVGMTISFCIPLMVYIVKDLSVYLLLLESAIEGIAGSSLLLIALTHSYASDLTQIDQRVVVFGRLTAGHYAGIGFGSATAGLLVKRVGLIAALLLMPVIAIICFVYLLLLPESMRSKLQADTTSSLSPSSTLTTIADSGMADINTESDREIANNPTIRVDDAPRKMSDAKQDAGTILYRLEKFYLSLFSPQLPNTLGGKHSVMLLMFSSTDFLADTYKLLLSRFRRISSTGFTGLQ
ncbi:hypothetical protein BGW38_008020 [Lunasporangiospora selenospora]|uniref:Major Facilitator Superfamily protein n=1 Tax=Lunasporangiospora selenospora TaxID=979761 RepID=A0A9P6G2E7_9FUNG|nr:hypothetical protein BGW38_008020 [Lunasporangiospora selenospora]